MGLDKIFSFLAGLDYLYLTLILFSISFFTYVIRSAYLGINKMVKKEKKLRDIEDKYNRLREHRMNLMV